MTTKAYNLELNEETDDLLQELVSITGLDAGEVIVNALGLYMEIIEIYEDGYIFHIEGGPDEKFEQYDFFESEDVH